MRLADVKVGMKVIAHGTAEYEVVFVGHQRVFCRGTDGLGSEGSFSPQFLEPVPEPVVYPEVWINVYRRRIGFDSPSRQEADAWSLGQSSNRIGVIHLTKAGLLIMEPV